MRENIGLYRGKRIDNDEWAIGNLLVFPDLTSYICCPDADDSETLNKYPVDPETVGEYTGLTDKNGKKIFEGDICDFSILGTDHTTVEISIKHGAVGFDPVNYAEVAPEDRRWCSFWRDDEETLWNTEYFCVIGNIHDNPELLEAADE